MIDLTKPVQTRDGRRVRVLCTDVKGESNSVVGLVDGGNTETCQIWHGDGSYIPNSESSQDLINGPEKRVVWVNMYPSKIAQPHTSKINADTRAGHDREACIRVEYEVGQFDEDES